VGEVVWEGGGGVGGGEGVGGGVGGGGGGWCKGELVVWLMRVV